jgi:hypothetical protein
MKDFLTVLKELQNTPVPLLLVGGGILFLFVAVGGQFGAKINADSETRHKAAGIIGIVLLFVGIGLYVVPFVVGPTPTSNEPPISDGGETSAEDLEGEWVGTLVSETSDFTSEMTISLGSCKLDSVCGTIFVPDNPPCAGDLQLINIQGNIFEFTQLNMEVSEYCVDGGQTYLQLLANNSLSYAFHYESADVLIASKGILQKTGE